MEEKEKKLFTKFGLIPESISEKLIEKVIRIAFKVGARVSMKEGKTGYFIGISIPLLKSTNMEDYQKMISKANSIKKKLGRLRD